MKKSSTGTGRRKRAAASVWLRKGVGINLINGIDLEKRIPDPFDRKLLLEPLDKLGLRNDYHFVARAKGGGPSGQVMAIRLGISRALLSEDETRRQSLKEEGFLTRDPRKRERKKYGQPGARKKFQFSKR
ncbi:MAG: 30S ribosomal protein S9 [Chlamydiota bacterium]|nr:30S ribosomal protein S9 [Chlamydiota bacterium]